MGTIKSKSKRYHIISNANDSIITVTGYIRYCIHEWNQSSCNYCYKSLFNTNIHTTSITSYNSVPICIISIIIRFYYFNEHQDIHQVEDPPLALSSLKVGDKIDAKDDWENFYPATILFIKPQNSDFPHNTSISRMCISPGIKYLYPNDWVQDLGLFIHYNGCSSRYDEWIFVKKHSICDCSDSCHYKDLHFISKPGTQSQHIGVAQIALFGNPSTIIRNSAGLANLGATSWLNAVLQCLYHTKALKALMMDGAYAEDEGLKDEDYDSNSIYSNNYKKSAKHHAQFKAKNALLFRLHDVFCNLNANEFGVASAIHIKSAILNDKHAPVLEEGVAKPAQFLQWLLKTKLSTKDRINHIFEGKYHSIKPQKECLSKRKRRWFSKHDASHDANDRFLTLNLPIIDGMQREFIINIYDGRDMNANDRLSAHGFHPAVRHRVILQRDGKVSDLEASIVKMYDINCRADSVFFYRLWGFRCCYVWNNFEPLSDVDDEIACYIIHNWKTTNHICHIHHVRHIEKSEMQQMIGNENESSSHQTHYPLAHDNYYSSHDTDEDETDIEEEEESSESSDEALHHHHHHIARSVHMNDKHVIHPYAFGQPFIITMPGNRTTGRLIHKIIYQRLYAWLGDEILRAPPPIMMDDDSNMIEDVVVENEWDLYLADIPYTLRWVHKDYNFYFDAFKPPLVTADDVAINYTWNYHANIVIEWKQNIYEKVKLLLNKIEDRTDCDRNDSKTLNIYDCLEACLAEKQVELWSLPEILVLNLSRFYKFSIERAKTKSIRSGYIPSMVHYPVNGLDLSRFMVEQLTMNAHYNLYAVLCHSQTNHFYAFCKTKQVINGEDEWYKFEDNKIKKVKASSLVNNKALILFYEKTKQNPELADHSLFNKYF